MPTNDADALVEVAALCETARAKLPASGCHRLRVLLDMILIDLCRETAPPEDSVAAVPPPASVLPDRT